MNWQYQAKATNVVGNHQLRYGVEYENIDYDEHDQPDRARPSRCRRHADGDRRRDRDRRRPDLRPDLPRHPRQHQQRARHHTALCQFLRAGHVEGRHRLTINPGVRYERQTLDGTLADLTLGNNWAPRIGATYDPTGQRHDEDLRQLGALLLEDPQRPGGARIVVRRRREPRRLLRRRAHPARARRCAWRSARRATSCSRASRADTIDPNVKSSYLNEAVAGFEFEARPELSLGVRFIHRDIPRVLEDVQPFPIAAATSASRGRIGRLHADESRRRRRRPPAISARASRSRSTATTRSN